MYTSSTYKYYSTTYYTTGVDLEVFSEGRHLRAGEMWLWVGMAGYVVWCGLEPHKTGSMVVLLSTAIGLRKHRIPSDLRS